MALTKEELISAIESMTVLELAELVKELQDKFGVSAAPAMPMGMPMGFAPQGAPADGGAAAPAAEEKDSFDVVLTSGGDKKIQVIKVVREITGLGLKEAKELVDGAPKPVKEGVTKEEAEKLKAQIEEQGGQVELK
ncbi:MAG: 50S ribosomal protein L7/L12 [Armatimonadaceae bacterium]